MGEIRRFWIEVDEGVLVGKSREDIQKSIDFEIKMLKLDMEKALLP